MTMQDDPKDFDHPARRGWCLLSKALECVPLEKTIDLARAAEAFVTGTRVESAAEIAQPQLEPVALEQQGPAQTPSEGKASPEPPEANDKSVGLGADASRTSAVTASPRRSNLALSPERREQLLQRLVQGAKNAELALEFGLLRSKFRGAGWVRLARSQRGGDNSVPISRRLRTRSPASRQPRIASCGPAGKR
jgi:hypothetical protein